MSSKRDPTYDHDLQMHRVVNPPAPDMRRLRFLRWLGERDRLEHETAGDSSGPLAADEVTPCSRPTP